MDKETIRKQLIDEIQAQFEGKLREAKRQKAHAEEELESASEKWRTERRRLNAEIDRLEKDLAEAHDPKRRGADGAVLDPGEIAKLQDAAEEKLKKAEVDWTAERTQLTSQISRLERAVADAIERSSNPMRSTQPIKDQFEARLAEAGKKYVVLEQDFLRARAEWDEDKKRLTNDLLKLRRLAPPSKALEVKEQLERIHGRKETIEEARIRELEEKLTRAHAEIEKYHQLATSAREDTKADYERRLEEAFRERIKIEEQLTSATKHWDAERQHLTSQINELQRSLAQMKNKVEEEVSRRGSLEDSEELREARLKMDEAGEEKERLLGEIQSLQRTLSETRETVSAEVVDQLRRQYDQKMKDMIQQKTQLAQELQTASSLLQSERARFAEEVSKSKSATAVASPASDVDTTLIQAEVARVESMLQEIGTLIDDPSTELSTVIRKNVEKAELDAYLKGILFSMGQGEAI